MPKKNFVEAAEADKKATETAVKSFDIDDFAGKTDEELTVTVGDYSIRYKLLSAIEVRRIKNELQQSGKLDLEEYGLAIIATMMNKVDGKTTAEKLGTLPSPLVNKILNQLGKASGFL